MERQPKSGTPQRMPLCVKMPRRYTPSVTALDAPTAASSHGSGVSTVTRLPIFSARAMPEANASAADAIGDSSPGLSPSKDCVAQYTSRMSSSPMAPQTIGNSLAELAASAIGSDHALASATVIFSVLLHDPTATLLRLPVGDRIVNSLPSRETSLLRQSSAEKPRVIFFSRPPVVTSQNASMLSLRGIAPPHAHISLSPGRAPSIRARHAMPAPSAGGATSSVTLVAPYATSLRTHSIRPGRYFEVISEKSCSHFALLPRSSAMKKVPLSIEPPPNRTRGLSPATTMAGI